MVTYLRINYLAVNSKINSIQVTNTKQQDTINKKTIKK